MSQIYFVDKSFSSEFCRLTYLVILNYFPNQSGYRKRLITTTERDLIVVMINLRLRNILGVNPETNNFLILFPRDGLKYTSYW